MNYFNVVVFFLGSIALMCFCNVWQKKGGPFEGLFYFFRAVGGVGVFIVVLTLGVTLIFGDDSASVTATEKAPIETTTRSSSSSSGSSSYGSKSCGWCGTSFSGRHYTHLGKFASCQISPSNSIGMWCSMKCCSEARRSSCPTCR